MGELLEKQGQDLWAWTLSSGEMSEYRGAWWRPKKGGRRVRAEYLGSKM